MQHTDSYKFFYLHDRLGSVRQVINAAGSVIRLYSYDPFGQLVEQMAAPPLGLTNSFLFAGQWYDSEIGQYYMRARQYDPRIGRFTARDPVFGNFQEPLTLHVYLYCLNDPVNNADPSGEFFDLLLGEGWGSRLRAQSAAFGAQAWALAGRIYTAAYVRAVGISMVAAYYSGGPRFNPNQQALIEILKRAEKTGVTKEEAKILMQWAAEYGIPFRDDIGKLHWIKEHINIWVYHIGLLED
jgi:RHS repeat-associated protein